MASLAFRGTASEFTWKPRILLTPSAAGMDRKAIALVSWKKQIHFTPALAHSFEMPLWYSRAWTSPCPCGFVCSLKGSEASSARLAWASARQGTFSCWTSLTWYFGIPKYWLLSSSATVFACVSPEVMITKGRMPLPGARSCMARMLSM